MFICFGNPNPCLRVFQSRKHFFGERNVYFVKRDVLGSPNHVCYVSGLPQTFLFFLDMPFSEKVRFCVFLQYLLNICQYLSMYGTAYVPTYYTVLRTVRYCVPTYPYRTRYRKQGKPQGNHRAM